MLRFSRLICAWAVPLTALAHAPAAQSQSVPTSVGMRAPGGSYNFDLHNGSISAAGTITTDSSGHATTIFGLVNDTDPITGLSTYAGADNDLYATGAWVTFGGLSFSSTSLGDFNFYNSGLGYYGLLSSRQDITGYADGTVAMAQLSAVPEPTTWAMMLVGFGVAGAAMRRRRSSIKFAQVA